MIVVHSSVFAVSGSPALFRAGTLALAVSLGIVPLKGYLRHDLILGPTSSIATQRARSVPLLRAGTQVLASW